MGRVHNAGRIIAVLAQADKLLRERDLRVGQFIMNAIAPLDDPFYLEDDLLAEKLEAYLGKLYQTQ
jgi:hypothetical protein